MSLHSFEVEIEMKQKKVRAPLEKGPALTFFCFISSVGGHRYYYYYLLFHLLLCVA